MTHDRDDAATRRYREANAALDERPSASTRAAILAAAARHVEAKPSAADAPRVAARRRWPLAAAAAVLLSTLAVMMAQRSEQEMPTFTAPAESSPERVAVAPAAPAPEAAGESAGPSTVPVGPASPPRAAQNDVRPAPRPEASEPGARAKKSLRADAAGDQTAAAIAPPSKSTSPAIAANEPPSRAQAAREQEAASSEARQAFPAAPATVVPAPAAPPPAAQKPRMELGAAGGMSDAAKSNPSSEHRARKEIAPAPAAAPGARDAAPAEMQRLVELSARDWLDRIIRLRGDGRHADADAELKRFRERYPDVQVPVAALPPGAPATGTR